MLFCGTSNSFSNGNFLFPADFYSRRFSINFDGINHMNADINILRDKQYFSHFLITLKYRRK